MTNEIDLENVSLAIILDAVCEYFGIENKTDVFDKTNKREVVIKRQWFHYFACELTLRYDVSYSIIGRFYKDITNVFYDHATVMHSRNTIQNFIDVSRLDKQTYNDILAIIKDKLQDENKSDIYDYEKITFEFLIEKYKRKLNNKYSDKQLINQFISELKILELKKSK